MIQVKSAMCDSSAFKLPSDAMPALFALSLRRKLRYLYEGQYFRFRVGDEEFDYPENEVPSNAYLVRIYDQKARVGMPRFDAVQLDQSKQPVITDNLEAQFEFGVYMDLENNSRTTYWEGLYYYLYRVRGSSKTNDRCVWGKRPNYHRTR